MQIDKLKAKLHVALEYVKNSEKMSFYNVDYDEVKFILDNLSLKFFFDDYTNWGKTTSYANIQIFVPMPIKIMAERNEEAIKAIVEEVVIKPLSDLEVEERNFSIESDSENWDFSPEIETKAALDNIMQDLILPEIEKAEHSIWIESCWLTNIKFMEKIYLKKAKGLNVRVMFAKQTEFPKDKGTAA